MLSNNPAYTKVFHSKVHNLNFYMPTDPVNGYHHNRYQYGVIQGMYASSGATKELTAEIYEQVKKLCEDCHKRSDTKGFMSINTLMDNLLYRHAYPVDGDCLLRMGAIYVLLEDEDPNDYQQFYTQKKEDLCKGKGVPNTPGYIKPDPELYSFFLSRGQKFTDAYKEPLTDITDVQDYLSKREEALRGLIPAQSPQ